MIEYAMRTDIRIDWSDLDALGHVNNLTIMRYMQTARALYLEKLGVFPTEKGVEIGPIMASVTGQFKKQLYYPGSVAVLSSIDEVKTTSMRMRHVVINEENQIAAEGHDIIVMFDFGRNVKQAIPSEVRERIESIERERRVFDLSC